MNSQRLGCLSPLALISAVMTLVILILAKIISGDLMFSPGALNAETGELLQGRASHAEFTRECGRCHAPFWVSESMSDRCLVCHVAIQAELDDSSSLHGALIGKNSFRCQSCHTDHNGPAASLTIIEDINFPHEVTGFSLAGHQARSDGNPFVCKDCHSQGYSGFDPALCSECHLAIDVAYLTAHIQTFGGLCLDCHDGVDRYGGFDHGQVSFSLIGAHAQVACSECHLNARTPIDLKNTPTACEACHLSDDAHDGKFGAACGVCHTPEAWKPATFDHSISAFPLDGAHSEVGCSECHQDEIFKGTPSECAACHAEPVYHAGMFPGQRCSDCHNTTAWVPALYEGLHTFPMNHGEQDNACADCHQPNLTTWTCYTCHERAKVEEEHIEEGISNFGDCLRCHPTGQEDEAEDRQDD